MSIIFRNKHRFLSIIIDTLEADKPILPGPVCKTLYYNTVVNFTGTVLFNDMEGRNWYKINFPVTDWVMGRDIGLDF